MTPSLPTRIEQAVEGDPMTIPDLAASLSDAQKREKELREAIEASDVLAAFSSTDVARKAFGALAEQHRNALRDHLLKGQSE